MLRLWLLLGFTLAAGAASAHTGHGTGGFLAGLAHPVLGWDHLAAMLAVGLWGGVLGRPAIWLLPLAFPLAMAAGALLGGAGLPLPGIEAGIAASALVLGIAVLLPLRPPLLAALAVTAAFAVLHGHAHGQEMPAAADPRAYALGFLLATGLLHLAGVGIGLAAGSGPGRLAVRGTGALIALAGAGFLTGAI